jgi:hypothetical protein
MDAEAKACQKKADAKRKARQEMAESQFKGICRGRKTPYEGQSQAFQR